MKRREFGVSFAVEASPWPVTSPGWEWQTGFFLGGSPAFPGGGTPADFAPLFLFSYRLDCGGSVARSLVWVLVRVFRGEPAPWSGRGS